jgi:uncharacterized protein (DUF362 family)/ferredoxin-like protein FixX
MSTRVSIVNINDHKSVPDAVIHALELIESDFNFTIDRCEKILMKPNLLRANTNACTRPIIVEGVISYLKKKNISMEKVSIGDSPGQIRVVASRIAEKIGLLKIIDKESIRFLDFEKEVPIHYEFGDAMRLNDYYVSKPVMDCDLLINLPRLKTHGEATITGAIKNYWGIIPGGLKARYHLLGKTPAQFGEALADNYAWVVKNKPNRITVYDLQDVMYGSMGPVSGPLKKWNLVLAGTDELALDIVALEIGKFKGLEHVPHLKSAYDRGLGVAELDKISIIGLSLEEAKKITPRFKVPGRRMTKVASYITGRLVYKVTKKIPVLDKKLCKLCGACNEVCPAGAIEFAPDAYPRFKREICISCLCCMEVCPHQAVKTKLRGFGGLFHA